MFRKNKNYIMTIRDFSEIRLEENEDCKILKREVISKEIFSNDKILDELQFSYLLNKFLSDVDVKDNLIIRNSCSKNLFRIKKVPGITEQDLEGYIKYNLDELLPFSKENISIESQIKNEYITIFGMDKKIVKFFEEFVEEMGFHNVFLTLFPSEFITFWESSKEKDFIFLNMESNYFEYFKIENGGFKEYNIITIKDLDLDSGALPDDLQKNQMANILDESIGLNSSLENALIYGIGDWDLINLWNNVIEQIYSNKIVEKPFEIIKYFGGKQ